MAKLAMTVMLGLWLCFAFDAACCWFTDVGLVWNALYTAIVCWVGNLVVRAWFTVITYKD